MNQVWKDEPNILDFEYKGYKCRILRNQSNCLCGYVGVKDSSKFYYQDYDDCYINVHGGLTYSDSHCPMNHENDQYMYLGLWWLGFDCAHAGDLIPSIMRAYSDVGDTYKDIGFVRGEIENMVDQIIEEENEDN